MKIDSRRGQTAAVAAIFFIMSALLLLAFFSIVGVSRINAGASDLTTSNLVASKNLEDIVVNRTSAGLELTNLGSSSTVIESVVHQYVNGSVRLSPPTYGGQTGTVTLSAGMSLLLPASGNPLVNGIVYDAPFGEGVGQYVYDLSGSGATGTITGSPLWTTWLYGGTTTYGALNFTNTQSAHEYVETRSAPAISSQITLIAWISASKVPEGDIGGQYESIIMDFGSSGGCPGGYFGVHYSTDGTTNTEACAYSTASSNAFIKGSMNMYAVTYADGYYTGYIDGSLTPTFHVPGSQFYTALKNIWIGANSFGGYSNETVSGVRIYDRALSPSEINAVYNNPGATGSVGVLTSMGNVFRQEGVFYVAAASQTSVASGSSGSLAVHVVSLNYKLGIPVYMENTPLGINATVAGSVNAIVDPVPTGLALVTLKDVNAPPGTYTAQLCGLSEGVQRCVAVTVVAK